MERSQVQSDIISEIEDQLLDYNASKVIHSIDEYMKTPEFENIDETKNLLIIFYYFEAYNILMTFTPVMKFATEFITKNNFQERKNPITKLVSIAIYFFIHNLLEKEKYSLTELLTEGEQVLEKIDRSRLQEEEKKALIIYNFTNAYIQLRYFGDSEKALKILDRAITPAKEIQNYYLMYRTIKEYAFVLYDMNEYDKAVKTLQDILDDENILKKNSLSRMGIYAQVIWGEMVAGNLNVALDLVHRKEQLITEYLKVKKITETNNSIEHEGINLVYAEYYNDKGQVICSFQNLEEGIKSYRKGLEYINKTKFNLHKEKIKHHLAEAYGESGNLQEANKLFKEIYDITQKIKLDMRLVTGKSKDMMSLYESENYYQLIKNAFERKKEEEAQNYYNEFTKEIKESFERQTLVIQTRVRLSEAFVLLLQGSLRDYVKAQDILNEIVHNRRNKFEHIADAIFPLLNLHLQEYQITKNKKVLDQINNLIQLLWNIGKENNAYYFMSRSLLMQSRLSILFGDLVKAENFLLEMQELGKETGFENIEKEAEEELESLKGELDKWKGFIALNASVEERIEHTEFKNYIKNALNVLGTQKGD